jgi:ComEC/Rec2-related protein
MLFVDSCEHFLNKRPFFLLSLGLLLGILTCTDNCLWALFLPFILWPQKKYIPLIFLCFSFGFFHSSTTLPSKKCTGTLYFDALQSLKGKSIRVQPYLFIEENGNIHKSLSLLPIQILYATELLGPPGLYAAKATLTKRNHMWKAKAQWIEPIQNNLWDSMREKFLFLLSQKTKKYVSTKNASFLISLFTGMPLQEELDHAFTLLGLKHIVAISGFHLSLIASFLLLFTSFLRSLTWRYLICITTLLLYLFILGITPSLLRSFLMFTGLAGSILLQKRFDSLNNFFAAFFMQLTINPYSIYHIGMQFSYLITFSLLTLYPFLSQFLSSYFPTRPMETKTTFEKYLYLVERFFFHAFCLQLAVLLPGAFLSLHYFQLFNLLSLLYNPIIPLLAAVSLFFYTLGVLTLFIEPLFALLVKCADITASAVVFLTTNAPFFPSFCLQNPISTPFCLVLVCLFISICLWASATSVNKKELLLS